MAPFTRREFLEGVLAAALVQAGCGGGAPTRPNVVCILIDQLRKDYADQHMHRVGELVARGGVVFEDMRSTAPWTYPSVVSLLSGLYPQQHGADGHARENLLSRFDPEVPLLQKQLRAAGFRTAAFITNPFLLDWNAFHLGFDSFDTHFVRSQEDRRGDSKVWIPEKMYANKVNEAVRSHFDTQQRNAPEFTYIHYIDAHGPWKRVPFAPNYGAAIRFLDQKVAEIYDYFTLRYAGDVLFFVTSDHGRAVRDDRSVGYGREWRKQKESVHDYNLRVPFLILPSVHVPQARRIHGPCSNVDFVPTVLDWLNLPVDPVLAGVSLLPAILDGESLPPDRPIYARHSAFGNASDAVVVGDRKYVRFFDADSRELTARRVFDLAADPRETRSIAEDFGPAAEIVHAEAGTRGVAFASEFRGVGSEVEEQLRALGYLGGSAEPD